MRKHGGTFDLNRYLLPQLPSHAKAAAKSAESKGHTLTLIPVPEDLLPQKGEAVLDLLSFEEALETLSDLPGFSILKRNLRPETIHYCKAELFSECVIGTLFIPQKEAPLTPGLRLTYYLGKKRLILITENSFLPELSELLFPEDPLDVTDIYHLFFSFLESLISNDMIYLQNFEKRLATMEESLADTLPRELGNTMMTGRRELLVFHSYYQQLMDLCEVLQENETSFFPPDFSRHFGLLGSRVNRLYEHTQVLRDYALQIREMRQSQIDLRQNETMRILTVVSTIFFPLSLIAGWYGMNFANMPELTAPHAYIILIGICVLLVAIEIWYFKKKGWF